MLIYIIVFNSSDLPPGDMVYRVVPNLESMDHGSKINYLSPVNTPPNRGPVALATANTAPNEPNNKDRSSRRVTSAIMAKIETKMLGK